MTAPFEEISPETLGSFLERFGALHDGLLRTVTLDYGDGGRRSLHVRLAAREVEGAWAELEMAVDGLEELRLVEGKATCVVLSDGVQVAWFDGRVFVAFSPYTDEPDGPEDFRMAEFFAAGEQVSWRCVERS